MRYFYLVLVVAFFSTCDPDQKMEDTGSLHVVFSGSYANELFEPVKAFSYLGSQSIKFSKLDFYVSGIELVSSSQLVMLDQVALIDLTSSDSNQKKIELSGIPAGDYNQIRFKVGVLPGLNKKLPKDFKSDHALANTSHYWDAWSSYIFSKIEGVVDTAGSKNFNLGFAIHTGTDECLQPIEFTKSFTINKDQSITMNLKIDIRSLFERGNSLFDLRTSPLNHDPNNLQVLKSFSARFLPALQLAN